MFVASFGVRAIQGEKLRYFLTLGAGAVGLLVSFIVSFALYILIPAASVFAPCLELFFETIHHIAAPARALAAKQA